MTFSPLRRPGRQYQDRAQRGAALIGGAFVLIAAAAGIVPSLANAQAGGLTPVSFTAEQAAAGETVFFKSCANCHGLTLLGGYGPALKGDTFQGWFEYPASDLFTLISTTMPQEDEGSLEPEAYAAVITYLLRENGHMPGAEEFPSDLPSLSKISLALP